MYIKDETLLVDFNRTALAFTNSLYGEFLFSIKDIDRLRNENIFQLWIQKYVGKLRQSLEGKALEYISVNRDLPTIDWFHKKLVAMIRQYLQAFVQRTQAI